VNLLRPCSLAAFTLGAREGRLGRLGDECDDYRRLQLPHAVSCIFGSPATVGSAATHGHPAAGDKGDAKAVELTFRVGVVQRGTRCDDRVESRGAARLGQARWRKGG
jgi:hypothetical protein